MKQSPIFIKSYETMVWILRHTQKFPKNQRFLMAKRMEDASLDFYEHINRAVSVPAQRSCAVFGAARRKGAGAAHSLAHADERLADLKTYNRLCKDLKLLAFNQYEYLAKGLDEMGRLLGGWKKSVGRRG